ncbi:MAG: polysaccharide biosynthesis tyrosine autokinase [Acidobacteria bacterium]|nr:MAG: polysaccharide biosynthesis tyrosine autokinase [Acidobacteriota bacterium]
MADITKRGQHENAAFPARRQPLGYGSADFSEPETAFDLQQIIHALWRRKVTILVTMVLVVIPVAVSTYLATPLYRSALILEIDPEPTRVLPYKDVTDVVGGPSNYELYMKTQDQILRSPSLGIRVANRLQEEQAGGGANQVLQYPGPIEVQRLPNSELVLLAYVSPDPERSARTVNLFAEEYIKQHFEGKQKTRERAIDFLNRELAGLKKRIEESEKEFVEYRHTNNLEPSTITVVQQKLAYLASQISNLETEMIASRTRWDALNEATAANLPARLMTENISSLAGKLLVLEQELGTLRTKYDENWPGVIRKQQEIELTREQYEREKTEALRKARADAEVDFRTAERRYEMLASAQSEQESLIRKSNEGSIQLNILQREVETSQQLYNGLMERLKQTSVTAGLEFGNIHIIEPGRPNRKVYSPNVAWNLGLGSLFALALGVCLAFVRDFWDRSLSSGEQAEELLSLPSLGMVPVIEGTAAPRTRRLLPWGRKTSLSLLGNGNGHNGKAVSPNGIVVLGNGKAGVNGHSGVGQPLSPIVSEAFRTVCASILLSDWRSPRSILVTSAVPGEGKTMMVAQLGRAFAESGARTIVLELDLRKPALSKLLGVETRAGLSLFLAGHMQGAATPEALSTNIENLFVMPAGPRPPNPMALLSSDRLSALLERLLTEYRFVLLDSPPVLTVADARVLSSRVQGVVLVAKAHNTSRDLVNRARRVLETAGGKVLGLALNQVESTAWSYSGYPGRYHDETYYSSASQ